MSAVRAAALEASVRSQSASISARRGNPLVARSWSSSARCRLASLLHSASCDGGAWGCVGVGGGQTGGEYGVSGSEGRGGGGALESGCACSERASLTERRWWRWVGSVAASSP